jgi:hypothetical protein
MALDRLLFGALLISLAACTAAPQPPVAPTVMSFPGSPPLTPLTPAGPASVELVACMEKARVAAMVAAPPGEPYPVADGCVNLVVENALSASFIVTRVLLVLDGSRVFDRTEPAGTHGPLATTPVFRVFLGPRAPGEHKLQVLINLRGEGTGPDAYLQGYRFEVRSSHDFTLASTGGTDLRTTVYEKGPLPRPIEERPAIRYLVTTRQPVVDPAVTAPPTSLPRLP